jgi:DNA-binding transcriptional LysR family regulator
MLHGMKLATFDLNHVRALHFLLEEAHVARAARRLGITAPAASNALRRLRDEFEDELLVRSERGLTRTPLGDELREAAREIMAATERLLAVGARFEPRSYEGDFELAMSDRLAALFGAIDRRLTEQAPAAGLRLRPVPVDVVGWLREVGGCALGPIAPTSGLALEHLFDDRYVCLLRRGHPLLDGPWSAARFAGAEHILVTPRGSSDRGAVDEALEARGLSRRISRVVPTFAMVPSSIAGSDRITTLPESFARPLLRSSELEVRPAPVRLAPIRMNLVWHVRETRDPRSVWFRGLIRDAAVARRAVGRPKPR